LLPSAEQPPFALGIGAVHRASPRVFQAGW
jgi:hypothetical protein